MLRTLVRGGAATVGIGGTALAAYAYGDPGFGRQVSFWRVTGPAVLSYAACSAKHKKSDADTKARAFAALHDHYSKVSLDLILELRGLYIKFGQAAASSPFVPQAYRTQFKVLQNDVPSEDFAAIKQVVEEELGPLDELFEEFSESACGAASIGQAHVAKLRTTGETVVVKVQYPSAARIFLADAQCLRTLISLANPEALPAFEEFEKQLALELDYRAELANLTAIFDAIMPTFADRVTVPRAHSTLSTGRVLTLEYLPGPKLEGEMRRQMAELGMRVDESESMRDWIQRLEAQTTQPATEADDDEREPWRAWLGRVGARVVGIDAALWVVGKVLATGGAAGGAGGLRSQEELRTCLHSLVEVHGFEIFVHGLFNADPHPGNLIAMGDGKVGLIDYGQCKRLEEGPRRAIAELMVKVADDAPHAEVAAAFRRVGVRTEHGGDEFLGKMARLMFGRVSVEMLEPKWHRDLHKTDKMTHYPPDLLMVHRVALILRGLSVACRENVSIAELWRPHAAAALDAGPD